MIAFEVTRNGKQVCTAGAEDLCVLNTMVTASGRLGINTVPVHPNEACYIHYHVGGLTSRRDATKDVHLRWKKLAPLKVGDIVQIKILETTKVDRPRSREKAGRRRS